MARCTGDGRRRKHGTGVDEVVDGCITTFLWGNISVRCFDLVIFVGRVKSTAADLAIIQVRSYAHDARRRQSKRDARGKPK